MKKKVIFSVLAILALTSILVYAYGTVKLLTVTDYGGGTATNGTYSYFQQSGYCFVSTLVNDSQGAQVQVRVWNNNYDNFTTQTYASGGPYQIQLGNLGPGDHVTISVVSKGSTSEYTTSELWQWQN